MDRQKVLVTGNAGFVGSFIVDELIKLGHEVYGVDDLSGGSIENVNKQLIEKNRFYKCDLRDRIATNKIVRDIKPEILYHLAACAREGASQFQPIYVTETNLMAYMNVLVPTIKHGLKKVVLFSSMSIYGDQKAPFDESLKRDPVDVYGINKAAMERVTEQLAEVWEFKYTIIRPHNIFAERQSMKDKFRNVVAIFMNRILRNEPLYIYGDGKQLRAFSYIEDSLPCYLRCLEEADGEIINIGGKESIELNYLADVVINAMEEDVNKYPREHLKDRPLEVKYAYSTYQKSVELLGYDEKIGWEKGIEKMAKWAKERGPQEWSNDVMELTGKKMPIIWE